MKSGTRRAFGGWLAGASALLLPAVAPASGPRVTMEKANMSNAGPSALPIERAEATRIAEQLLAATAPRHDFVIVPGQTVERDFGWVFFYVPRRYAQTRDPKDLVPGNGPLAVYRATGKTEFLPSSVPPQAAIAELERRLAKPRP